MTRQVLSARKMVLIAALLLMGMALLNAPRELTVGTSAQDQKPPPKAAGNGFIELHVRTTGGDDTFSYTMNSDSFTITTSGGTGFAFFQKPIGDYAVTQSPLLTGWEFMSVVCSDPTNDSSGNGQTANVSLGVETVTCTFTNTKCPVTLTPTPGPLPAAQFNTPYSRTFAATGACASDFKYSLTNGALPAGLKLGPDGVLSGTAKPPGDFTFTVKAENSCGCTRSQTYTLQVACPLVPMHLFNSGTADNGSALADGTLDAHYRLTTPSAAPGTAQASAPLDPTWLPNSADSKWLVPSPGSTGLGTYTYSTSFELAGCDLSSVIITGRWASNSGGFIRVNGNTRQLFQTTPGGFAFTPFKLDRSNSVFVGGTNTLEFVVNNQSNVTGLRVEMSGSVKCCGCVGAITISPLVHQTWGANQAYPALNLMASGGVGSYAFKVTGGSVPPGMDLDLNGKLQGTPVTPGTYDFAVTAKDAHGCPGVRQYRIEIINCPAITINPTDLPSGSTGTAYSQVISATGGCASSFTYTLTSGTLPNGLTLGLDGLLSGTATQPGTYDFTVTATDNCGCSQSRIYTLTICTTWPLRLFNTGVADNGSLLASGATDPHYVVLNTGPVSVDPNARPNSHNTMVLPQIEGYVANSATSQWLGPQLRIFVGSNAEFYYTYRTTFDLANCDPSTAVISGQWATDKQAEIFLNDSPTAITTGPNDFGAFTPFVITSGFRAGVNTLDFRVRSGGLQKYTGLRVEMGGSVKCCLATGSLTVTKTITAPSFQRPPSTVVFPTTVACLPFGPDVNLNLSAGAPTQTLNNIPAGSTCTVTEGPLPAPFESQTTIAVCKWSTPTYSPSQSVVISNSASQTVTIQNHIFCERFGSATETFAFTGGMNEFCFWGGGGGGYNSQTQIDSPLFGVPVRSNNRVRFGAVGLCYGRILSANNNFAFKYTFNAIPVAVLSYRDVNPDLGFPGAVSETRRNVFGAGFSPIGFQLYFRPQDRIKPFVNTSGGFIFFKDPVPRLNGARFNFTYDFGGGIQVFRDSRRAFNFGYKYQRISNGGHAQNNPGFNAHIFYFGYSIFSAPKIAQTDDVEVKRKD